MCTRQLHNHTHDPLCVGCPGVQSADCVECTGCIFNSDSPGERPRTVSSHARRRKVCLLQSLHISCCFASPLARTLPLSHRSSHHAPSEPGPLPSCARALPNSLSSRRLEIHRPPAGVLLYVDGVVPVRAGDVRAQAIVEEHFLVLNALHRHQHLTGERRGSKGQCEGDG